MIPAPQPDRTRHESFFALFAGPVAWYLQLCAGYALASWSCGPGAHRNLSSAMVGAMLAAVLVALLSLFISWRTWTEAKTNDRQRRPTDVRAARDRFLALWGMLLGGGFAFATIMTGVALIVLPRCTG